jgi:uncharacterized protein YjgD (DUF1641 family)
MGLGESGMDNDLALLHAKIDRLTEIAEAQRKRQEQLEELAHDLLPVANQAVKLTIEALADIGNESKTTELVFLFKRVMRDTQLLNDLLGRAEAAVELMDDVLPLSKQMMRPAIEVMGQLEAKGYFGLARGGYAVAEKVAANYTEADLRALAENMPALLTLARNVTKPELLKLANDAVAAVSAPSETVSLWQLAGVMFDAKMRQGLGRMLKLVKVMAG